MQQHTYKQHTSRSFCGQKIFVMLRCNATHRFFRGNFLALLAHFGRIFSRLSLTAICNFRFSALNTAVVRYAYWIFIPCSCIFFFFAGRLLVHCAYLTQRDFCSCINYAEFVCITCFRSDTVLYLDCFFRAVFTWRKKFGEIKLIIYQ